MKVDWKRKLTSRKFWAAVVGFATAIVTAFKIESITAEQVTLIITATATLIAYIVGEGFTDVANAPKGDNVDKTDNDEKSEPESIFKE